MALSQLRADALVRELDLDLDSGICHACLSFVSFALDDGDPGEIRRQLRQMTPNLWLDGLEEPALAAVRDANDRGVADARSGLVDLERSGGASPIARAIVRRLAEELSRRTRKAMHLEALSRPRLPLTRPDLN